MDLSTEGRPAVAGRSSYRKRPINLGKIEPLPNPSVLRRKVSASMQNIPHFSCKSLHAAVSNTRCLLEERTSREPAREWSWTTILVVAQKDV